MSNVIHMRERDLRGRFLPKVDPLWMEFVGNVLAMELEHALIEPLDGLDMDEKQIDRLKESF